MGCLKEGEMDSFLSDRRWCCSEGGDDEADRPGVRCSALVGNAIMKTNGNKLTANLILYIMAAVRPGEDHPGEDRHGCALNRFILLNVCALSAPENTASLQFQGPSPGVRGCVPIPNPGMTGGPSVGYNYANSKSAHFSTGSPSPLRFFFSLSTKPTGFIIVTGCVLKALFGNEPSKASCRFCTHFYGQFQGSTKVAKRKWPTS